MSRRVVRRGMNMEWVLLVNWSIGEVEEVGGWGFILYFMAV